MSSERIFTGNDGADGNRVLLYSLALEIDDYKNGIRRDWCYCMIFMRID